MYYIARLDEHGDRLYLDDFSERGGKVRATYWTGNTMHAKRFDPGEAMALCGQIAGGSW